MTDLPFEHEPLQPLKFQTDSQSDSFLIYSRSTAIFVMIKQIEKPDYFDKLQDATDMREPLQKKFFMGTVTRNGELLIDVQRGELLDQGW